MIDIIITYFSLRTDLIKNSTPDKVCLAVVEYPEVPVFGTKIGTAEM